ncbi:BolA family transcriptional regulator [Massilia sp. Dwa41.01b]|uniref:BolA family protein n=1 Tax=unclassified Massilia TaxID=2609279 RepID=UPI0015FF1545|nr:MULTISPECIES: BolA family protein [unclassified Massilia]QNA89028.1 BolA family transcriptional regulator [Massilia sp. Dwa41.01b]QNA99916.1 BolA family transcriptional regulator [Massilia sp. Se16.2.3]
MNPDISVDSRPARIRERLQAALAPTLLEVGDDSHLHAGHAGAASGGGHYSVKIVSDRFAGQRLVMRHRLVYDAVADMMAAEIHALAITALAPSELD